MGRLIVFGKKYWPLFLIFLIVLGLYFPVFSLYFSQDDFFHLKMSQAESIEDFLGFFSPKNPYGYSFYRPLTTQVYLFGIRFLFGLQPLFFHLVAFVFFLANLLLVFKIVEKTVRDRNLGFLAAFLYAINASNLGSLAYISVFEEIGMAFFFFLSFWFYLQKKKWAFLTFILALLSRETAIIFPLLLIFYEWFLGKKEWQKTLPFWFILFLYGLLRIGTGLPNVSVYQPIFSLNKIANSFFWYFLWGLGLPEMLVDFVGPGLKINPNLFNWYRAEMTIILGAFLLFLVLAMVAISKLPKKNYKKEIFLVVWFLVTLLPVIFWPWHKFSYYLTVPLLGLVGFFVLLFKRLPKVLLRSNKLCLFSLAILAMVIISLTTIFLSWKTYWVVNRAKISQNLVSDLKNKYSQLPKGASLYFQND
ncbi:hypothetical protein COU95_03480, partial [Candidatus Shapirobacteria bacterium CG10_big_fil_rev_8_21_14_0_10_40_9]